MTDLTVIGEAAKKASRIMNKLGVTEKNRGLKACAEALMANTDYLIAENEKDMIAGKEKGMNAGLLDRLKLTPDRVKGMAQGLLDIINLDDPVGEVISMKKRPNGLLIGQKRVPIGVIGIIYESRPNVTADAFGLCFKTGNAVILKGGSDAINSNLAIATVLRNALKEVDLPMDAIHLFADTDRATTTAMMRLNEYIDVLIPRGGAGLIRAVVQNSTVPVIETGTGNCHVYVDESADLDMALNIIMNAKTQRVGVCNACESILLHEAVLDAFTVKLRDALASKNVEMRADEKIMAFADGFIPATEEDWGTEYLDYIVSIKSVSGLDEAIDHINRYNTGHSECIVTEKYENAQRFLDEVDAAAVYVNASTRFTDGGEFGFGAEIGISTQKLHARGPMGLLALTTSKYIIYGNGQIR